jgi:hypothetical protein
MIMMVLLSMYDENKSKDLFINYKKSFKDGGLISMFREKR